MKTSFWANRTIDLSVYAPTGISRGNPRFAVLYPFERIPELMPSREILTTLRDDEAAYQRAYVAQLETTGVATVRQALARVAARHPGKELVLMCFEQLTSPATFCHRRMFAAWWHEKTGESVDELVAVAQPSHGARGRGPTSTPVQAELFDIQNAADSA